MTDTDADWLSPIYFVIIVVLGGFFMLNLILAVIMDSFAKVDKNLKLQELKEQLKKLELKTEKSVKGKSTKSIIGKKSQTAEQLNQLMKIDSFQSDEDAADLENSIQTEKMIESAEEESDQVDKMKNEMGSNLPNNIP